MLCSIRRFLVLTALVCTTALSACLPDEKDPGKASDAGKLNGNYYASALGNTALKIQNNVVSDASWFTSLTSSMQLDLAAMGVESEIASNALKSTVCPTGTGTQVVQLTWIDGRDSNGKFSLKGIGTDTGQIIGSLKSRVGADQLGTYNGSTSVALTDGHAMAIPSSCAGISIPLGAPVLAFKIDRPAAPVSEMARTEYRSVACGNDTRGIAQRGTMVQSRVVRYSATGQITPADANTGWTTDNMGQCVSDTTVTATSSNNATGGSVALNAFADIAAQGLKGVLDAQLQMGCKTSSVAYDYIDKETGQRKQGTKNVDTCTKANAAASGTTLNDTGVSANADIRNVCPRNSAAVKPLLTVPTGTLSSLYGGIANIERVVDEASISTDNSNRGERRKWQGTAINCSGTDTYTANCNNVPGQPTGPDVSASGGKWNYRDLSYYFNNEAWYNQMLGFCFIGCEYSTGGGLYVLNWNYFNSKQTMHGAGSTATARRTLSATSWTDPYTYFIPNFNVPPSTLGWTVPGNTNACLIQTREIQLSCPLYYDPSKLAGWGPYELSPSTGFFTTLIPGGSYGGQHGQAYHGAQAQGETPGLAWINWKSCNIKGCDYWTDYAGPGTDAYIKSWIYGDTNSVNGAWSTVQTIMMNKDGQIAEYRPAIQPGPAMRYKGAYTTPLHCGRIERRDFSWPVLVYYVSCGGKGGCWWSSYWSSTTVTEVTTREWSGDNATVGTWSQPNVVYTSPYGTWGSIGAIPNPIIAY